MFVWIIGLKKVLLWYSSLNYVWTNLKYNVNASANAMCDMVDLQVLKRSKLTKHSLEKMEHHMIPFCKRESAMRGMTNLYRLCQANIAHLLEHLSCHMLWLKPHQFLYVCKYVDLYNVDSINVLYLIDW